MKLAEAVIERKALTKKIAETKLLIGENLRVEEGDEPDIDVTATLDELEQLYQRFYDLVTAINDANNLPQAEADGQSISALIVRRDVTKALANEWRGFVATASSRDRGYRYGGLGDQPKTAPTIPLADLRAKATDFEQAAREIDMNIQRLDWVVDVVL